MRRAFFPSALLAFLLTQGFGESTTGLRKDSPDARGLSEKTVTEIRLTENTMGGREAVASNGFITLRVRGLYQQMFSGKWYMGIKVTPLQDVTISKITCYSFNGKNTQLPGSSTNDFSPPAGEFRRMIEREVDVPFPYSQSVASMSVTFYDERGGVLSRFEITHIVDHMVGTGLLPAANRESYLNSQ